MMISRNNKADDVILGIDLGTGSLKTVLLDLDGKIRGRSQSPYPTHSPHPGWAQQDPEDWITALSSAVPSLLESTGTKPEQIRSIGLCGAAHIPVLLDRSDRPTCPAILWNDCRSVREVEHLEAILDETITRRTTNKVGCAWTLPQLLWLRNHIPEALDGAETFLTSKDYLVYLLTGEKICDTGSATATMLYDPRAGQWVEELIEQTGLPLRVFPEIIEPTRLVGETTSQAVRFGLKPGIPVVSGCLDSVSEMIAAGGRRENDCVLRLGTAGAVLVLGQNNGYLPGLYNYPFPCNGLSIFQAGTSSCGSSLDWMRNIFNAPPEEIESVAAVAPGADGLFFHPFLHGERAPYFNPELRGSFIGLTSNHRRKHFFRAVLEGVGFSLLDCMRECMQEYLPESMKATSLVDGLTDRIRVVGGGTRLPMWMNILSSLFNRELLALEEADSSIGAAILAADHVLQSSGVHLTLSAEKCQERVYRPDRRLVEIYEENFHAYQTIAAFLNSLHTASLEIGARR